MNYRRLAIRGFLRGPVIWRRPYGLAPEGVARGLKENFQGTLGDWAAHTGAGGKATSAALVAAMKGGVAKKWFGPNGEVIYGPVDVVVTPEDVARGLREFGKDDLIFGLPAVLWVVFVIGSVGLVLGAVFSPRGRDLLLVAGPGMVVVFAFFAYLERRARRNPETPEEILDSYGLRFPRKPPPKK